MDLDFLRKLFFSMDRINLLILVKQKFQTL